MMINDIQFIMIKLSGQRTFGNGHTDGICNALP